MADFPAPKASCLSPVGEYNLRLGIMKEVQPDPVATFSGSPSVIEGHPFVVEAGVCIGGPLLSPVGVLIVCFFYFGSVVDDQTRGDRKKPAA